MRKDDENWLTMFAALIAIGVLLIMAVSWHFHDREIYGHEMYQRGLKQMATSGDLRKAN